MKLKVGELIKNYPPKLRELALLRAKEGKYSLSETTALQMHCDNAIMWARTLEGSGFWNDVYAGREIDDVWAEEPIPDYQIF